MSKAENIPPPKGETWEEHWGNRYSPEVKRGLLQRAVRIVGDRNIGDVVVDIGSGEVPLSHMLHGARRVISVDLHGEEDEILNTLHVQFDIEELADETSRNTQAALGKVAKFLRIERKNCQSPQQVDTMLFSEVLNYVDFRKVLTACSTYLKDGGRFIILNQPNRGFEALFGPKRVGNNTELLAFFEESDFDIEHMEFPYGPQDGYGMILLVAKKRGGS